jgi:hypothetical protein
LSHSTTARRPNLSLLKPGHSAIRQHGSAMSALVGPKTKAIREPAESTRSNTRRTKRESSPDQIAPCVTSDETRCTCNGRRAPCNSHATVLAHIEGVRSKQ